LQSALRARSSNYQLLLEILPAFLSPKGQVTGFVASTFKWKAAAGTTLPLRAGTDKK